MDLQCKQCEGWIELDPAWLDQFDGPVEFECPHEGCDHIVRHEPEKKSQPDWHKTQAISLSALREEMADLRGGSHHEGQSAGVLSDELETPAGGGLGDFRRQIEPETQLDDGDQEVVCNHCRGSILLDSEWLGSLDGPVRFPCPHCDRSVRFEPDRKPAQDWTKTQMISLSALREEMAELGNPEDQAGEPAADQQAEREPAAESRPEFNPREKTSRLKSTPPPEDNDSGDVEMACPHCQGGILLEGEFLGQLDGPVEFDCPHCEETIRREPQTASRAKSQDWHKTQEIDLAALHEEMAQLQQPTPPPEPEQPATVAGQASGNPAAPGSRPPGPPALNRPDAASRQPVESASDRRLSKLPVISRKLVASALVAILVLLLLAVAYWALGRRGLVPFWSPSDPPVEQAETYEPF